MLPGPPKIDPITDVCRCTIDHLQKLTVSDSTMPRPTGKVHWEIRVASRNGPKGTSPARQTRGRREAQRRAVGAGGIARKGRAGGGLGHAVERGGPAIRADRGPRSTEKLSRRAGLARPRRLSPDCGREGPAAALGALGDAGPASPCQEGPSNTRCAHGGTGRCGEGPSNTRCAHGGTGRCGEGPSRTADAGT